MKIDGGVTSKQSYMGTVLTVLLWLVSIMFAYTKINTIAEKQDVDIMTAVMEDAIDQEEKFTA